MTAPILVDQAARRVETQTSKRGSKHRDSFSSLNEQAVNKKYAQRAMSTATQPKLHDTELLSEFENRFPVPMSPKIHTMSEKAARKSESLSNLKKEINVGIVNMEQLPRGSRQQPINDPVLKAAKKMIAKHEKRESHQSINITINKAYVTSQPIPKASIKLTQPPTQHHLLGERKGHGAAA